MTQFIGQNLGQVKTLIHEQSDEFKSQMCETRTELYHETINIIITSENSFPKKNSKRADKK